MHDELKLEVLVAEQAKIDEGVKLYIDSMPRPETLEQALLEREFWITEACRFSRNEDYYRGLLDEIAAAIGPEAWKADNGDVVDDEPVRARLPDLVKARTLPPANTEADVERVARAIGEGRRRRCGGYPWEGDPNLDPWLTYEDRTAARAAITALSLTRPAGGEDSIGWTAEGSALRARSDVRP